MDRLALKRATKTWEWKSIIKTKGMNETGEKSNRAQSVTKTFLLGNRYGRVVGKH